MLACITCLWRHLPLALPGYLPCSQVGEIHAELGDMRKAMDSELSELRSELRSSVEGIRQLILGASGGTDGR